MSNTSAPGILPVGEYGYVEAYWFGTTTCSTVHSESNPAASAASPTAAAPPGVA
jgi:hypothetical protein